MAENYDPNSTFTVPIELPEHLFIPRGALSIDARAMATVPVNANRELLLEYRVPKGMQARIISYGIFNDGLNEADYRFIPEINGKRTLQNHGRPIYTGPDAQNYQVEYILSLGLAPDLSNLSLIKCSIDLKEFDILTWRVNNTSAVENKMGVRIVGYEFSSQYTSARSGS